MRLAGGGRRRPPVTAPGTLERAVALAAAAHAGETDKAGAPMILHPLRVMLRLTRPADRIVAALHDVVENGALTLDDLRREGFSPRIVAAVDRLSRRKGEAYGSYVRRAGADPLARRVKLADLADNMDLGRVRNPRPEDLARRRKYARALGILNVPARGGSLPPVPGTGSGTRRPGASSAPRGRSKEAARPPSPPS